MMKSKLLKLARMVMNLAEIETDKAKLIIEGEAEVGKEVFVEDENGELVAPEDGEYVASENILVIADGKIAEVREKEQEEEAPIQEQPEEPAEEPLAEQPEEPAEEEAPVEDEKDAEIAKLRAQIEELNNIIAEKDEEIGRLKAELEKSDAEPAEEQLKSQKTKEAETKFTPRFIV